MPDCVLIFHHYQRTIQFFQSWTGRRMAVDIKKLHSLIGSWNTAYDSKYFSKPMCRYNVKNASFPSVNSMERYLKPSYGSA